MPASPPDACRLHDLGEELAHEAVSDDQRSGRGAASAGPYDARRRRWGSMAAASFSETLSGSLARLRWPARWFGKTAVAP